MSDYKSMRIKKTNELDAAISSVPKDLYQWSSSSSGAESKRSSLSQQQQQQRTSAADDASSISSVSSTSLSSSTTSHRRQMSTMMTPPSFPAPPARVKPLQSTLKLNRPNSLKDFEKMTGGASTTNHRRTTRRELSSAQPIPSSSNLNYNNQEFDLLVVEDLSDSSWSDFNSRPKSMTNSDSRPYLNSGRRKSPGPASFREVSDREAELVSYKQLTKKIG